MKILAVANQKGGVGKTTLSLHIAQYAAKSGLRVLMVDFDNQGSLSLYFNAKTGLTASNLFLGEDYSIPPLKINANLSILRADDTLLDIDKGSNSVVFKPKYAIKEFSRDYDLCVVDTAGVLGVRMTAALAMANSVITPVSVGLFELSAIEGLVKAVLQVKQSGINPKLKHIGMLPMKTNGRSKEEFASLEKLRGIYGGAIMSESITERAAVKKSVANRLPIWDKIRGVSHQKAAAEWENACKKILASI